MQYEEIALESEPVKLFSTKMTYHRCRFPIEGRGVGLIVCGAQKHDADRVYCRFHARVAYTNGPGHARSAKKANG